MSDWHLSDAEWERLGWILAPEKAATPKGGRPRLDNDREAAEACLFRHYHELAPKYHCFGCNQIPAALSVSPSTANRRFNAWAASGAWARFWDALMRLRNGEDPDRHKREPERDWGRFPAGDLISELERAYAFFNDRFFAGTLDTPALTVERPWGRRRRAAGAFCPRLWRLGERAVGHVALSTEVVGQGAEAALGTLLHEMVHLRNDQVGVVDCTSPYQYHNRFFRDAARLAGLDCPRRDRRYGYAETALGPRGKEALAELAPRGALFAWRVGSGEGWS